MGHPGFYILVWDGWGLGLNMLNPRLLDYYDEVTCRTYNEFKGETEEQIDFELKHHKIKERFGEYYTVIVL
jgi:hypothetical protein